MKRITDCFILPWLLLLLATEVSTLSRHERRRYKRGWMSGTKPQGATCTFNPCDVPNFCNGGRKCELDDSCKHHCICTEDSTHESCVTTVASTVKPVITSPVKSTVSCAFNPCNIPNFCSGERECEIDDSCRHKCVCTDQSTHESCVSTTSTVKPVITTLVTSNITTPKVTCAFNPCNIPNFCSGRRDCKMADSCRHHCVCTDESTHESCAVTTSTVKPVITSPMTLKVTTPKVSCAFNPCTIPNFCGGGRECEMDDSCRHKCLCTDQSYHESCIRISTSTKKTIVTSKVTLKVTTTTSAFNCVFNPCSVDNFCGDGRRCEISHTCKHMCVCLDNFTHDDCKGTHSTTTPAIVCAFNPCATPDFNFCGEGRRCEFDRKTCKHDCICLDDVTHDNCKAEPPIVTESPDDDKLGRDCPPGFPCKHGYCEQPGFKCICDENWSGIFCDKDMRSNCTRECEEGTKCMILPDFTEVCVKVQPHVTTTGKYDDDASNACSSNYKLRNEAERTCQNGKVCHFGVCIDKVDGRGQCECDPGAVGTRCTRKCCRNCGENGVCFLDGLEEICNCHYNYIGPDCSELKPQATEHKSHSNLTTWTYKPEDNLNMNKTSAIYKIQHLDYTALTADPNIFVRPRPTRDSYISLSCGHLSIEGPPEEVTWYLWIVGVCAAVLVLLIILLLVVPYVMWKYRVIMVMKIVHYFQSYEDDDDRQWDAFISYSQRDYKFVVHTLYPKLELEQGFKLIMHHRDFLGGETISNNIINAVKNSRRTILVITPNFVKSEYTRFEYQVAQQEMLKRKHRIIPVLLDDISECKSTMDPNLQSILSSVTYLEWPNESDDKKAERFWKRLQLSLPKKRQNSDPDRITSSETVKSDDIKISVVSNKDTLENGVLHSNKAYYSEPDADYDTINELELDDYKSSTHKVVKKTKESGNEEDRYVKIDSYR